MAYRNSIVHLDLDTFFVSVEKILDKKLENKPIVVGGSPYGRGVVAGCSYEARAYGIHSGQSSRQAARLCPDAVFLHGSYIHYAEYSKRVTSLLKEFVPLCQKSSVDEFYVDLSHTERLKGDAYKWAQEIRKVILGETHLPISFGLATNKLIAKVATTQIAKNNIDRHHHVPAGYEKYFLSPFPVRAMPGIGEVGEQKITRLGIHTIGQLSEIPPNVLQRLFGKTGRNLHDKANGIDLSPVIESREQKSYSREQTFNEDTIDNEFCQSVLLALSSQLAADLRAAKFFAGKLTLKLRYSDFQTVTKSISCSYTNRDRDIYQIASKLFRQLCTRRVRRRLLGIEATDLLDDYEQLYIFPEKEEDAKLYPIIDNLRHRYGSSIIRFAGAES